MNTAHVEHLHARLEPQCSESSGKLAFLRFGRWIVVAFVGASGPSDVCRWRGRSDRLVGSAISDAGAAGTPTR